MDILQAFIEFFVGLFTAIGILTSSISTAGFNATEYADAVGAVGTLAGSLANQANKTTAQ